jgi:hypothetical protein
LSRMAQDFDKTKQDFDRARASHETTRFQFILTELDLATTFCEMALSARRGGKARRNLKLHGRPSIQRKDSSVTRLSPKKWQIT